MHVLCCTEVNKNFGIRCLDKLGEKYRLVNGEHTGAADMGVQIYIDIDSSKWLSIHTISMFF